MQANSTLPQLNTPLVSDIKKVFTAAGVGIGAFFLSKLGRDRSDKSNSRNSAQLPQRRSDALTTEYPTLKEAAEVDASLLGNKGLNLSNLLALGFNVPSGFVVTTRIYEEHIRNSGAETLIEELNAAASENGSTDVSLKCDEIKARILAHPVSEGLHGAIKQFLAQRQGDLGVAVRSSSNQEDSNGKAFAGQFDTFLNFKSAAEVSDAVKKVWASLWTPHVITYQQSMAKQVDGTLAAFPKMAVVIQEMVDSYVSGVAFTVNPMGTPDEMMIESYFGQGEMVVASEVSPDQFIVAKNEKLEIRRSKINLAKQAVASADKTESGGLNVQQLPKDLESAVSLNDERVKLVAHLAINVENSLNCPQDIEFAFDKKGKLFLLQARPITTNNWQQKFSFLKEWKAPGPGTWALEGVHMYQAMSRMFYNVYPDNQKVAMQRSAQVTCSMLDYIEHKEVNGFAYMCMRFVGAPADARGPPPKFFFKLAQRFHPAIRERFKNAENVFKDKVCRRDMEYWMKEDKRNCYNRNVRLAAMDRANLSDDDVWAHFMDCYENAGYMVQKHHIYTFTSLLPMQDLLSHMKYNWGLDIKSGISIVRGTTPIGSGVEEFLAEEIFKAFQQDPEALLLLEQTENPESVLDALKPRAGVGPAVKKYEIQAGYRLTNGYDVVQQTLIEQPALLLHGLKKTFLYGAGLLPATTPSQSEIDEVRNRVPAQDRALFDELLAEAQFMHPLRDERSMYGDMMGIGLLRHAMLEVGQRLVNRNILPNKDIATEADLHELEFLYKNYAPNEETEALNKLFAERRLYRKTVTIMDVPQHLGPVAPSGPKIPPLDWFPKHTHRIVKCVSIIADLMFEGTQNTVESIINDKKLVGAPGARGIIEGKVTVIRSIEADREKFQSGDILVTYATSSAFCMLLSQSSGVVAQEGGALTHAAITARELNIPAVVACKGVMQTLRDGMRIRVNGTTGEVFILDANDSQGDPTDAS